MTHADDARTVGAPEETAVDEPAEHDVTAHECSPERTVFTEKDNSEGWIATDTTVDLRR